MELKATIHGTCPSKSNCYRFSPNGQMYKSKALKEYEKSFFIQCPLRDKKVDGYFEFYMDVFYPSQRADLDNSLKIVLDCLQGTKTVINDNKCVFIQVRKFLDKNKPRIEFVIKPID
jgi:Holliday junction resolvase RusA-like endonuclease